MEYSEPPAVKTYNLMCLLWPIETTVEREGDLSSTDDVVLEDPRVTGAVMRIERYLLFSSN